MKTLGNILIAASLVFFIETAFEMYLLTLIHGQQLLFFSLAHVAPGFLLIMALSGIAFVCLAIFALVVVVLNRLGKVDSGGNYPRTMLIILLIQVVHTTLLVTYDYWAAALFS